MIQFFSPELEETLLLPEGESSHCVRVLRMIEGDEIYVTDGKGNRFKCLIEKAHHSRTKVRIIEKETFSFEKNYRLILAVAPTKNVDRMEWLAEKAVEIGVAKIVLLRCERSERKILKKERLEKIMVSAMKQSLSVYLPEIEEVTRFGNFVRSLDENTQKFFGYCSPEFPRLEFVKECLPGGEVVVMIGPEGDFTPDEVKEAVNNGFKAVTFGNKRLRTETAGVYAVCAVDVINQLA